MATLLIGLWSLVMILWQHHLLEQKRLLKQTIKAQEDTITHLKDMEKTACDSC